MTVKDTWVTGESFGAADENAVAAAVNANTTAIAGKQDGDADLTAIAGLSPSNDDVIQRKAGAWTNRTPAQLKTDLALAKGDVGLGNVDNTSNATERAAVRTLTNATMSGAANTFSNISADSTVDGTTNKVYTATEKTKLSGIATGATANDTDANLKARANHTGTQTASTISDFSTAADARITAATGVSVQAYDADLGTIAGLTATTDNVIQSVGSAWASRTPAQLKTTLALAKGDVGLGNVDNTSNATERAATAALTNKDLTSGTNTFPTFNQNTTGSAATLTTGRTVRTDLASTTAVSFNGSANITPGVTGTLPVANGGTGAATFTTNAVLLGNGTSAVQAVAPSTAGYILGTDGTTWTAQPLTRVTSITSSATPALNTDTTDQLNITALAVAITSMTTSLTGTPRDGQRVMIRITGTATRTIAWGTSFASSGVATLLATTSGTNTHLVGLQYDSTKAKWICIAVDATGY